MDIKNLDNIETIMSVLQRKHKTRDFEVTEVIYNDVSEFVNQTYTNSDRYYFGVLSIPNIFEGLFKYEIYLGLPFTMKRVKDENGDPIDPPTNLLMSPKFEVEVNSKDQFFFQALQAPLLDDSYEVDVRPVHFVGYEIRVL